MTTINGIARTETEENLNNAVESLNIDKVQDLLTRFNFNEDSLKALSIYVLQKDDKTSITLDIATLLLKDTGKQIKEYVIKELRKQPSLVGTVLAIQLHERLDL